MLSIFPYEENNHGQQNAPRGKALKEHCNGIKIRMLVAEFYIDIADETRCIFF